ncbi:MAG: alpha/beta hydrolase family protein [Povalibacter sp.]
MKKKTGWTLLGVLLIVGAFAFELLHPQTVETRYTGAYALPDESYVFISPEDGGTLRYRTLSGQSGLLWRTGTHRFEGGRGFADRIPAFNLFNFELDSSGHVSGLSWQQTGGQVVRAPRVKLTEQIVAFDSGNVRLRGKLVMPSGGGSHPAVVVVHGSEETSAVDRRFEPYLYASAGFATLVFDKRGTGESQGELTMNFRVLATDVMAALKWLRDQPGIDGANVHLVGFSQGGWVAPMAAARDGGVRSVLVCYGPLVSVFQEDRWGYVSALKAHGFDDAAIAEADRVNDILSDIVDRRQNRWSDLGKALVEARSKPWFDSLKGANSLLSDFAHSHLPLWGQRMKVWWILRKEPPFIDRLYDPVPTAAALKGPSYWLFGEQDSTMPTEWTVEALNKLQRRGKPVDYLIYPEADHGGMRFEQLPEGERRILGYEPDFFKVQLDWLKRASARAPS